MSPMLERVSIIGSGNWGSAISRIVGANVKKFPEKFDPHVSMWVFEEMVNGRPLTQIINEQHENVRYMPGLKIPENVVAYPNLKDAVKDATALVFVLPEQFLRGTCKELAGNLYQNGNGVKAISLIKGVDVQGTNIHMISDVISEQLGISCSALSGANIANEVAAETFSETSIGYKILSEGEMWKSLFHTSSFRVSIINDVAGVSLCGALKNIVALAAGFVDGLGWGSNSKAAVMRIGLLEMKHFSKEFFEGVLDETFVTESCGVADLITTCIGGRNRRCAEAFVKTGKPFDELENEMLDGQKLQGTVTAHDVYRFLHARGREQDFPLFTTVYKISYEGLSPERITDYL